MTDKPSRLLIADSILYVAKKILFTFFVGFGNLFVFLHAKYDDMKKKYLIFSLVAVLFLLSACITPKKVNYLQDMVADVGITLNDKFEDVILQYD